MNIPATPPDTGAALQAVAQHRRWLVLLAMTGSLSMIFVDMTVVGIALPSIGQSLDMGVQGQAWVVSSYLLALASLVAIGGRVGDLMGKVPAFMAGVIGFAISSVVCAQATGEVQMLVGRVLQGVSACLMQPASSALVISSFSEGERGKAMAVYVGIPLLFMALGPALGGIVVQYASWRWVFYLNIPVAALAIALTMVARPRDARSPDRSIDWFGGALLLTGLPLFVLGLQELGALLPGSTSPASVAASSGNGSSGSGSPEDAAFMWWIPAALVVGALLLVVFARRQWRISNPLLHLRLFTNRSLRGSALVIGCMQFAMTGFVIQGSIYAQEVLGYTPLQAGASLLPLLIPVILMVHVAGRWYDRVGVRAPAVCGTALATLGQLVQALGAFQQSYPVMAVGMAIMGTGIALTISPSNTDALSRVAAHERGQVSGLVQTMRQVGGTMGVAITAATVIFAQTQLERSGGHVTHAQLQELREQFKSKDAQARERALADPRAAEARAILSSSMAAGGVVASLSTAAAFVLAARLLERKTQRPKSPR